MLIAAKVMKPFGEPNRSPRPEVWGLLDRLESQEARNGVRLGEWGQAGTSRKVAEARKWPHFARSGVLLLVCKAWQTHR